jgi:hypothetical protein
MLAQGLGGASPRIGGREIAVWTLAAFAQLLVWTISAHPHFSNDSYQYLSVAENLRAGRGIQTSLVHFDVERARGTIPTPLTTFAPGYSIAVALVSGLGIPPEKAGIAISLLSMTLTLALLGLLCNALELHPWGARAAMLLYPTNAYTLWYAGAVGSDPLFTLLLVAAVTCAVYAEGVIEERQAYLYALSAGIAAGMAYWVRYAGLLVIGGLGVTFGLLMLVRRNHRSRVTLVLVMVAALVPVAVGFARNLHLTGTWQGGNTKVVVHPLVGMLKGTATSFGYLMVGYAVGPAARACQGIFVLALAFALLRWRRLPKGPTATRVFVVATVTGIYSILMFYVGLHSCIKYTARMFMPVLPLLLLMGAAFVGPPPRTALGSRVFALAGLAGYALCGPLNFGLPTPPPGHLQIASRLAGPTPEGTPLHEWIDQHIGREEPVIAADGQATGHYLRRPVVSLVGNEYSDTAWTEAEVERTMDRFGIRWLFLYVPPKGVETESLFLTSLVDGRPDRHLRLAARNEQSLIFERDRGAQDQPASAAADATRTSVAVRLNPEKTLSGQFGFRAGSDRSH